MKKSRAIYFITILIAAAYLLVGHTVAVSGGTLSFSDSETIYYKAVVTEIAETEAIEVDVDGGTEVSGYNIYFEAEVKSGEHKGEILQAV